MDQVRRIVPSERTLLAGLLEPKATSDAFAAYYALDYSPDRVELFGSFSHSDQLTGFLVVARTGLDLFRPLVIPFTNQRDSLLSLIKHGLNVGQRAILHIPLDQISWLENLIQYDEMERTELYRMDLTKFTPILNVLVVREENPDGRVRSEIRAEERVLAASGINWVGSHFAEIYVFHPEEGFNPNYIRSVISSVVTYLIDLKRIPLLRIPKNNVILERTITEFGFKPTGITSLIGSIQRV